MGLSRRSLWFVVALVVLVRAGPALAQSPPFPAPGPNIVGLVWVEDRFWASHQDDDRIYRQGDGGDWEVWPHWSGRPGPISWDGTGLWIVDEAAGQIKRFDLSADVPTRNAMVPIPEEARRQPPAVTGLTWDGTYLWLATGCGLCSKIFAIDPTTGGVAQSFFPKCDPRGIAFAHEHPLLPRTLWTVAYNGPYKPALLTARIITADPTDVSGSQQFYGFGSVSGSAPPDDPTTIAIHEGIWVVDRDSGLISKYDPGAVPP